MYRFCNISSNYNDSEFNINIPELTFTSLLPHQTHTHTHSWWFQLSLNDKGGVTYTLPCLNKTHGQLDSHLLLFSPTWRFRLVSLYFGNTEEQKSQQEQRAAVKTDSHQTNHPQASAGKQFICISVSVVTGTDTVNCDLFFLPSKREVFESSNDLVKNK